MKKKIYIAGKVTGLPEKRTNAKFSKAEKQIELLGLQGVNPIKVVNDPNAEWRSAMRVCIFVLMGCDGVLLLTDWMRSKGARLEVSICDQLGIPTFNNIEHLITWNNSQQLTERKAKK